MKENYGLNTDAFTLKRWPNVKVISTYGSVTHHRQFIYKITHQALSGILSVARVDKTPTWSSLEGDEGSLGNTSVSKLFVFPNITSILVVQSKWKSSDFPIFKHF